MKKHSNSVTYQQDIVLQELIKNKAAVSVYMRHGIKLTGRLIASDNTTLLLQDVVSQLIYKSAVSTILPSSQEALDSKY